VVELHALISSWYYWILVTLLQFVAIELLFNWFCYNRVVVQLVLPKRDLCETFLPIWGTLPLNLHAHIMCLGLILDNFLHVYLKDGCLLPPPCMEWKNHKIGEAEQWKFAFMDRQALLKDLMSKEPKPRKKPTNHLNSISCDNPTPEKQKGEFEVIEEHEDDVLSVAS